MTGVGARADVGPASWEVPAAAVLAWLAAAALLLPAGRGVAAVLDGGGWVWPTDGAALAASVGGLLVGDPDTGLDASQAAALPGTPAVYAVIAVLLVAFLGASGGAVWAGRRLLGTPTGMADRSQVEQVLGRSRLRRAAAVVRPDLSAPAGRAGRSAEPHAVGWRLGVCAVPAAGRAVGALRPDHRRLRPAGLGQDPGPARPGAAGRARRGAGDADQGRGPAAHPRRPRRRRAAGRRAATRSARSRACRSWCGTRSPVAGIRWSPSVGPRRSPPAPSPARSPAAISDGAARFYAFEAAKVLQAYFHAAALTGGTVEHVLEWAAHPQAATAAGRHPAGPPAGRAVVGRAAARRPARRPAHRREHRHDRAAGAGLVLPGRHPPPLHSRARPAGHRGRRVCSPPAAPSTCSAATTPTPRRPR